MRSKNDKSVPVEEIIFVVNALAGVIKWTSAFFTVLHRMVVKKNYGIIVMVTVGYRCWQTTSGSRPKPCKSVIFRNLTAYCRLLVIYVFWKRCGEICARFYAF